MLLVFWRSFILSVVHVTCPVISHMEPHHPPVCTPVSLPCWKTKHPSKAYFGRPPHEISSPLPPLALKAGSRHHLVVPEVLSPPFFIWLKYLWKMQTPLVPTCPFSPCRQPLFWKALVHPLLEEDVYLGVSLFMPKLSKQKEQGVPPPLSCHPWRFRPPFEGSRCKPPQEIYLLCSLDYFLLYLLMSRCIVSRILVAYIKPTLLVFEK